MATKLYIASALLAIILVMATSVQGRDDDDDDDDDGDWLKGRKCIKAPPLPAKEFTVNGTLCPKQAAFKLRKLVEGLRDNDELRRSQVWLKIFKCNTTEACAAENSGIQVFPSAGWYDVDMRRGRRYRTRFDRFLEMDGDYTLYMGATPDCGLYKIEIVISLPRRRGSRDCIHVHIFATVGDKVILTGRGCGNSTASGYSYTSVCNSTTRTPLVDDTIPATDGFCAFTRLFTFQTVCGTVPYTQTIKVPDLDYAP